MTVSSFQDKKPVKKEASITYDFTLLNWLFKDAEVTKRAKDMKKNNSFNLRFFQIFGDEPQGRYQEIDIFLDPMEFDWGKPFYVITDEGYINHTKTNEELTKAISQAKPDEPVQVICCPPTKEDLDSIYTMTPDIQIAAILS